MGAMAEARAKGKTPLVLDDETHRVDAFFMHSGAHIIECKKMIMDKAHGSSASDILEEERRRFMSAKCFQYGQTVMFRLANTACDLVGAFNSETFPTTALMDRVQVSNVMGTENAANMKGSPLLKIAGDANEELELSACGIHADFNVVVVTHFEEASYEEFLATAVPLHLMQPIMALVV